MHPSSNLAQGTGIRGVPRLGTRLVWLLLGCTGLATFAGLTSDLIRQIARPCTDCYLGAFEPPIDPYGHALKHSEAIAAATTTPPATSVRAVPAAMPGAPPEGSRPWLVLNGALALGRTASLGAIGIGQSDAALLTPNDGAALHKFPVGGVDFMYPWTFAKFEPDVVNKAAQDPWRSTAVGRFSEYRFHLSPLSGAPSFPGSPSSEAQWRELTDYRFPANDLATGDMGTGNGLAGAPTLPWFQSVAVQKDLEQHFVQIGPYGLNAIVSPGASQSVAPTSTFTGVGADAEYRFAGGDAAGVLSAHSMLIHEARWFDANSRVGFHALDTFRTDLSWTIDSMVTPSIQYFRNTGSADAMQDFGPGGRSNSAGVIAGLSYVPWSQTDAPLQSLNLRFDAQYVSYMEPNGISGHGAGGSKSIYLSLWGALHF